MNLGKHIWEGWRVIDFIQDLEVFFEYYKEKLTTKEEVKKWCMDNQSHYKKHIPEVVTYFWNKIEESNG